MEKEAWTNWVCLCIKTRTKSSRRVITRVGVEGYNTGPVDCFTHRPFYDWERAMEVNCA